MPHKGYKQPAYIIRKRVEARRGYKHSDETKKKISEAQKGKPRYYQRGKNHGNWKGNKAGKYPIYMWVKRMKGKPKKCEICGSSDKKVYDWANKDHRYKRKLSDYISLCRSCHRKFDIKNNNYKKNI